MFQEVFKREENKYLLTDIKFELLMNRIKKNIGKDKYSYSTITNIYYDTDDFELARISLEKPTYREKFRLRCYSAYATLDTKVFFEIKKKYKNLTSKRRISLDLNNFYEYVKYRKMPNVNNQIMNEIDFSFNRYKLQPKIFIGYERYSYYLVENENIRITFDKNLRSRTENLLFEYGDSGKLYFDRPMYIMEIKSLYSLPIWFVKILNDLEIYPASFTKYGNIYKKEVIFGGKVYV